MIIVLTLLFSKNDFHSNLAKEMKLRVESLEDGTVDENSTSLVIHSLFLFVVSSNLMTISTQKFKLFVRFAYRKCTRHRVLTEIDSNGIVRDQLHF